MTIKHLLLMSVVVAASFVAADTVPAPSDNSNEIPNIVVVATRTPRPVMDVAASVTVVDADQIANQLAISVADLVRYEPAISVARGGTRFGDSSYSIRGIGGNRVAIEIDGVPVADQFDIGSYSDAERNLVDVDLIDRVEILRGPASTLYGSDAIGGVVAYTTIDPDQFGDDSIRFRGGHRTDDGSASASLTGAWTNDALGALVSIGHRDGNQLDAAALAGAEDQRSYQSDSLFAKVNWDIDSSKRLTFTTEHFERDVQSDIRSVLGSGRFRFTTLLTGDDSQTRDRFSVALDAETDHPFAEQATVLFYHQRSDSEQITLEERADNDLRRLRTFNYLQEIDGIELGFSTSVNWFNYDHRLSYGLDVQRIDTTELRDGIQTDLSGANPTASMLGENFPVRDFPVSRTSEYGIYIHDEISRPGSRWTIIPALRYDQYDLDPSIDAIYLADNPDQNVTGLSDSRFSPKLGLLFDLTDNSNLFLQYAQGFRAPPFEDANIGLDIPLFNIRAIPNPDLKSETSKTLELGWRLDTGSTRLSTTLHYTDYQDFIETKVRLGPDPATGVILFQSQNINSAHIYGAELQLEQQLDVISPVLQNFDARISMAWTDGQNDQTGETLGSVSPSELVATLRWQSSRWPLSGSLQATLVDNKHNPDDDLKDASGFATFDILANYQFDKLTLRAGIFNLADKTYWHWADIRGLSAEDPLIPHLSRPGRSAGVSFALAW